MNDHGLIDFLDFACAPGKKARPATEVKDAFRKYLTSLQIEYTNYAMFHLDGTPDLRSSLFETTMASGWIEEYLDRAMYKDDYVLTRLENLNWDRPQQTFYFGSKIIDRLGERDLASAPVLKGAADAGMVDAIGLIGITQSAGAESGVSCYSFGFGGEAGTNRKIEANMRQIKIAASVLIESLRPEMEALAGGFDHALTPRERDILCRIADGEHRDTIGYRLGISVATVDMHLRNLRTKLGSRTLSEAVAKGFRFGILS